MTTLVDVFRDLERKRGEFVVYDDGYRVHRHSYADVTRAARGFAVRLAAAGVGQGDKVLFWGENCGEWLACYWGCVIAGVIVVPIDYRSSADFALRVADIVEAKLALLGEDSRLPPVLRDAGRMPGGVEGTPDSRLPTLSFRDLDWAADGPMPAVTINRDDVAQIVFTSGATADPKGVVVRHRNLLANLVPVAHEVAKYRKYAWPFFPIRFLNLLPLSHLFGQSMATNIPPLVDGTVVFMRSLNPHDLVRRVKDWRISVIVCVPKILDVLKEHASRIDPLAVEPPPGLSIKKRWWRYRRLHRAFGFKFWAFIVGAAPLGQALEDFWKRLGFVVIQGYGLTETAPIVTLNHPFKTNTGSVGTPIGGVEVKIADDGEILVRGENVTTGYYDGSRESGVGSRSGVADRESDAGSRSGVADRESDAGSRESRTIDAEGWLHTGDIGEKDAQGRLFIRGRKKEMIVRADGLNVFPDDVERVVNEVPGVVESAVVGRVLGGDEQVDEQVHAALVLAPGTSAEQVVSAANAQLPDHQRIRGVSVWTDGPLPRTEGTKKLKRQAVKQWVAMGAAPAAAATGEDPIAALLARYTGAHASGSSDVSFEALGLSSLDRVELMVALEDKLQTRIDEARFAAVKSIDELRALVAQAPEPAAVDEPVDFPRWNRSALVGLVRRVSLATWILPIARIFARITTNGVSHLDGIEGPVVFAVNHQSHIDVPAVLAAMPGRWRARVAPAMAKEFFKAHFFPAQYTRMQYFSNSLNYYLAAFFFNAFPLPQREAGARQTLRYIGEVTGDGFSVLIFPEGVRAETEEIQPFRGGIGMIASRLNLPIVPVRIEGANQVLHPKWKMAKVGRVRVTFGQPMRLHGDDYAALAARVEQAVRAL